MPMHIVVGTLWLTVTNIALGLLTVAFWLAVGVVVIREILARKRNQRAFGGRGGGSIYVSESGILTGSRRSHFEKASRN